jgi:hypothetical protein
VLLAFRPAAAQQLDSLTLVPGDLVRFAGPLPQDVALVNGRVVGVTPFSFDVTVEGQPGRVFTRSYDTLRSIDVGYRSRARSARVGAVWGLFLGGALGLITGPLVAADLSIGSGPAAGLFGGAGGLVGAAAGAATGAVIAPLRWNRYVFQ